MTKVCVIGDSHLAAIKAGWRKCEARYPQMELRFFGSPKGTVRDLNVENGRIEPANALVKKYFEMTSGGDASIEIGAYGAFVLVGLKFSVTQIVNVIYKRFRSDAHNGFDGDLTLVSEATFFEASRQRLRQSISFSLAQSIAKHSAAPIYLVPQPRPSEDILTTSLAYFDAPVWQTAAQSKDDAALDETYSVTAAELARGQIHIIAQPAETRIGRLFSKREYTEGAVRLTAGLDVEHDRDINFGHLNGDYGALVVEALMRELAVADASV